MNILVINERCFKVKCFYVFFAKVLIKRLFKNGLVFPKHNSKCFFMKSIDFDVITFIMAYTDKNAIFEL